MHQRHFSEKGLMNFPRGYGEAERCVCKRARRPCPGLPARWGRRRVCMRVSVCGCRKGCGVRASAHTNVCACVVTGRQGRRVAEDCSPGSRGRMSSPLSSPQPLSVSPPSVCLWLLRGHRRHLLHLGFPEPLWADGGGLSEGGGE